MLGGNEAEVSTARWVTGDDFGLAIPADAQALLEGGPEFLTAAFRACGAIDDTNRVTGIVESSPFSGGGTGTKQLLSVTYAHPDPDLPEELFVKYSRNFDDELQDRGRTMMVSEATFAVLSRTPDFPVPVPRCMFADVEAASATGLLITDRVPYGHEGVEPLHPKCMDHLLAEPVEHYEAILRGLARLSGTHRAGGLPDAFDERFPYDPAAASLFGIHAPLAKLEAWAERMFEFIARHPQLVPDHLREPELRRRFLADLPDVVAADGRIREVLGSWPESVAFSHWNANIDNCWFERDVDGELVCGFIDWANAGQIGAAQAITGAISGAEPHLWRDHLDHLLAVYDDEFAAQGAPRLDLDRLRLHVLLIAVVSGVGFSMGAPVALTREIGDLDAVEGPRDPVFTTHDNARVQLHMMTKLLENWRTFRLGDLVRQL